MPDHDITEADAVQTLHNWIDQHSEELVTALQGALRIPSLQSEPEEGAPFGTQCLAALEYTLGVGKSLGFAVHNDSGYAGHLEFGAGTDMIAALGHLDVVPEGDGWNFPPYGAEIHNGYIYARGASDDKGPTFAALFAAAAILKGGLPVKRRVRVVLGCNEESGFECVKHYWETANNERPVAAFTPDSRFPLIYAEKGIAGIELEKQLQPAENGLTVTAIHGGRRPNMVPDSTSATLTGSPDVLEASFLQLRDFWDKNVVSEIVGEELIITAGGKSAHAARPEGGDNAIARLARAIASLRVKEWASALDWINRSSNTNGSVLGIAHSDDVAGPLTSNLGLIAMTNENKIKLTYNIRYPVTWSFDLLLQNLNPVISAAGWDLVSTDDSPPLYVPQDKEPVKTLLRVYREETGDYDSEPGTMGGGTYARATPYTVAYGAAFPGGTDGPAHEPNERIAIESLIKAAKIYAHALYALATADTL
jgi:succinyl-diaminopimelate desuccinylase